MDPQNQQQMAAMIASMGIFFALFGLVLTAFFIFLFWRIFTKAGLSGPLSLLVIVPVVGPVIVLCILAFSQWRVTPAPSGYALDAYPTQGYPPSNYPPTTPPTQL